MSSEENVVPLFPPKVEPCVVAELRALADAIESGGTWAGFDVNNVNYIVASIKAEEYMPFTRVLGKPQPLVVLIGALAYSQHTLTIDNYGADT